MACSPTAQHQRPAARVRIVRGFGYPAPLLLSAELRPSPPGSHSRRQGQGRTWIPGRERHSKGKNTEPPARGKAKHFKERRATSCPTSARSPTGFKTSLSPAARRKMLSSSRSKCWLREEVVKASKALRKERFQSCLSFAMLLGDTWNKRRGTFQTGGGFVSQ